MICRESLYPLFGSRQAETRIVPALISSPMASSLAELHDLLTAAGQAALATAVDLEPTEATYLKCFAKLSRLHPAERARAALEQALLRQKALAKFRLAAAMYFTRLGLE